MPLLKGEIQPHSGDSLNPLCIVKGFVKDECLLFLLPGGRTEVGLQQSPSFPTYKRTSAAAAHGREQQHWEGDLLCWMKGLRGKASLQHLPCFVGVKARDECRGGLLSSHILASASPRGGGKKVGPLCLGVD